MSVPDQILGELRMARMLLAMVVALLFGACMGFFLLHQDFERQIETKIQGMQIELNDQKAYANKAYRDAAILEAVLIREGLIQAD